MATRTKDLSPPLAASLLLALFVHGALIASGTFRGTYDAYVHMFFGDHYSRDWFSTWETRWYTGFTTVSYPPGTHQLIALISKAIGLEAAFMVVQLVGILILVVGVYRMASLWAEPRAARWAALLAVLSTSIAEAVHVFGQLPTIVALGLLLNATPYVDRWLRTGDLKMLLAAITTLAATTACHHVTTLFGSVFFLGPIIARVVIDSWRAVAATRNGTSAARFIGASVARSAFFGGLLVATLIIVVLPYWLWSSSDPISQVPIPHDSRANFLKDINAGLVFWVIPWGVLVLIAMRSVFVALRSRCWPAGLSVVLLTVLGTGGTTPIPRLLLGGAFDILTLDRFTFWATIAILPFAGVVVEQLACRAQVDRRVVVVSGALGVLTVAAFIFTANLGQFRPLQPEPIDPAPIADFLGKDQHDRWRYLTLGFGDQMAWVSAHTTATTVDGNYHSARRLPELVSRPVERLEGAKFRGMPGLGSLDQFVTTPERYNLKFVFSNDTFYDPLLFSNGWHRVERLLNGIIVWERADITPLPDTLPASELPPWQRFLWGVLPLTAVTSAAITNGLVAAGRLTLRRSGCQIVHGPNMGTLRHRFVSPTWLRVACVVGVTGVVVAGNWETTEASAAQQVYDFYDDIDFGRLDDAWERIDPYTGPSLEQYRLERSVRDGLVDGYAKLDRLEIIESRIEGGAGQVDVAAHYVTSLTAWTVEQTHIMVERNGEWFIGWSATESSIPVEQFARQTTVEYVDHGRRRVTTETSDYGDILDRPRVEVRDHRLVKDGAQWNIVGQITNLDIDPADITVTGRLLGDDGNVLATYQAGEGTVHKLLPGETAPFRVAFEGVATVDSANPVASEQAGVFDPESVVELRLEEQVASYQVEAKALVTGKNLERLVISDAEASNVILDDAEHTSIVVRATINNRGTETATIPIAVVSLLDVKGNVLWVESHPLSSAIQSQRSGQVELTVPNVSALEFSAVAGEAFDNGRSEFDLRSFESSVAIPVTVDPFFADSIVDSVSVTVISFERGLQ